MARYKEYDRDEVLEKTVGLFWQKGFKTTSMADIVQATGLNTASMYKEFGDKDGVFEETLKYYRQHIVSSRLQILIDQPNLKGIQKLIQVIIDSSSSVGYKGCLMMNHLAQINTISPEAANKVDDFCMALENLLETAFQNAQESGDISKEKDPAALANFVLCNLQGLTLFGRRASKEDKTPKLYDIILSAF